MIHDVMDIEAGKFNTYSGQVVDILNPTPETITLEDIVQGLNNYCRFGGQLPQHYSVAEHSVLVSMLAPEDLFFEALIHDASEAYLGDMISPLKKIIGKPYKDIEERWMKVICTKFGVDYERLQLIKPYDEQALQIEFDYFFQKMAPNLKLAEILTAPFLKKNMLELFNGAFGRHANTNR